ncbi:MAG TPA: PilZ domain-containing protein [Kofleriaceae bacterium]|nr:PilZ domain-containing protein [Kofleriaceae bacterium]
MNHYSSRSERRRDVRVSPKGTVIVRAGSYVIRGRIANLSRGGISTTTRTTAPQRLLGSAVALALRFDSADASWLELSGRVLRIGASSIAMALSAVPASFTRIIDETVSSSHHHDRVLSIVLVDATPRRRSEMAEGFRAAGCAVIDVSTPLEAIVRLGESHFEPDLIAIADSLPETISDELRRFVNLEHPRAKLVTIGDATSAPAGLLHWLSAVNTVGDLAARIRKVLVTFDRH